MKFEIVKGQPYVAKFVLKQTGSTTPLELSSTDTGLFYLSTNGANPSIVLNAIPMTISDAINGQFRLELTEEQTSGLKAEVALEEDGYPSFYNYKATSVFNTEAQGQMIATIAKVYVIDIGL